MDKASLILLTFCGLARAQSYADQTLKQLASTCRDLYEHGYAVDIYRRRIDQRRFAGGSSDMPRMHGPGDGAIDRIVLGRLSPNLRFELVNSGGEDWQWTTNGQTIWCYRRDLKAYTEAIAAPWPQRLGPGDGLPGYEWKYFAKFLAIEDEKDRARVLKDDIPPDHDCEGASVLIELTLAEGDAPAREELRVLTRKHLPCHSTTYFTRLGHGRMPYDFKEDITWRFRDQIDPSLFVFAPDKHARKVARFRRF
jgi:hypothetical protein